MDQMMIINVFLLFYMFFSGAQIYLYKDSMSESALHHLLSHTYMVGFFLIAFNLWILKGWTIPLIFVMLHVIQHVTKENIRLTQTNKWTDSVEDVEP